MLATDSITLMTWPSVLRWPLIAPGIALFINILTCFVFVYVYHRHWLLVFHNTWVLSKCVGKLGGTLRLENGLIIIFVWVVEPVWTLFSTSAGVALFVSGVVAQETRLILFEITLLHRRVMIYFSWFNLFSLIWTHEISVLISCRVLAQTASFIIFRTTFFREPSDVSLVVLVQLLDSGHWFALTGVLGSRLLLLRDVLSAPSYASGGFVSFHLAAGSLRLFFNCKGRFYSRWLPLSCIRNHYRWLQFDAWIQTFTPLELLKNWVNYLFHVEAWCHENLEIVGHVR